MEKSVLDRCGEYSIAAAFIALLSSDIVAVQMDQLHQIKMIDEWSCHAWLPLLILMIVLPALARVPYLKRILPARRHAILKLTSLVPLGLWLAITLALVWVSTIDERAIPLRTGTDTDALLDEAQRQGIPVVIETHSSTPGWTIHFDAKYLSQVTALCRDSTP